MCKFLKYKWRSYGSTVLQMMMIVMMNFWGLNYYYHLLFFNPFFFSFTKELMQSIVKQINMYAAACLYKRNNFAKRITITLENIMNYVRFMTHVIPLPLISVYDCWQKNPIFYYLPLYNNFSYYAKAIIIMLLRNDVCLKH